MAAGAPNSPRFESDKEDGEDSKTRKLVFDGIDAAAKCDGVDVDKRMLDGRKANRGFTISTGTSADPDFSALRNSKRAQTLPADCSRRGDFNMSEDSKKQLEEMQQHLLARYRHGSVSFAFDVIPQEVLDETFKTKVVGHTHGLITEGQQHGDERERVMWGNIPLDPIPLIACQKGCKGFKDTSPNQDNFSVTHFKSGYTLICTFDGHGPF
ncbi:cysI, partial [Symbiodinium pilosum]